MLVPLEFLDIFILPEIGRRKEAGKLEDSFNLRGAQVIFFADGKKPEIRINSEIRAIASVKFYLPAYDREGRTT